MSALALSAALVGADSASASACLNADAAPGTIDNTSLEWTTVCLLNEERAAAGLKPLKMQQQLRSGAVRYSQMMVDEQFFSHDAPNGSTLERRAKTVGYMPRRYRSWALGENIAWATGQLATPAKIVDAWMHSEGHRENILDGTFREIGVGVVSGAPTATGSSVAATYTSEFGVRY